jgi:hypothetical protein
MKGDFTRDTFDPAKHFTRVLLQQGRVTLDADFNEQSAILLHTLRTVVRDIIGDHAGPVESLGFELKPADQGGLTIGPGRYYVRGILCENNAECAYASQPDYTPPDDDPFLAALKDGRDDTFGLYLDVWERHITFLEDDSIREKALDGPDTCTRAKVVWQVKALRLDPAAPGEQPGRDRLAQVKTLQAQLDKQIIATTDPDQLQELKQKLAAVNAEIARLEAGADAPPGELACQDILTPLDSKPSALAGRVDPGQQATDPCVTSPQAKYRGPENQLYRVEIHTAGKAGTATFKWSRNNGSVAARWVGTEGNDILLGNTRGFTAGAWVELSDDTLELRGVPGVLVKIASVQADRVSVDPTTVPVPDALAWSEQLVYPKIRQWDQVEMGDIVLSSGAVPIVERTAEELNWIDLEDGIQVQFAADGEYRAGDYWLIPARVATGSIEWPTETDPNGQVLSKALAPRGIQHYYAPLGLVAWNDGELQIAKSCRCEFDPINKCFQPAEALKPERPEGRDVVARHQPRPAPAGRQRPVSRRSRPRQPPPK